MTNSCVSAFLLAFWGAIQVDVAVALPLDNLSGFWVSNSSHCSLVSSSTSAEEAIKKDNYEGNVLYFHKDGFLLGEGEAVITRFDDHNDHFVVWYDWGITPEIYRAIGIGGPDSIKIWFPVNGKIEYFFRCQQ